MYGIRNNTCRILVAKFGPGGEPWSATLADTPDPNFVTNVQYIFSDVS